MTALDKNHVNRGTEVSLTWSYVTQEMQSNRPIYSSIIWNSGGTGHAHVIRGYFNLGYSMGVSYVDPASGTITSKEWSPYLSNSSWHTGTALVYLYPE